jgi:hypothetical protein
LLLVIDRRGESPGRALVRAGAAGALIGVATWLRPNLLLFAPLLALFVAALSDRWRAGLARAAVVIAGMVVVVAPITLRNWVVYHELVPVSINGGITLLHGVAEAGGRRFGVRSRDKLVIEEEATYYGDARLAEWWAAPDGIRRDRERYREALREMRAHPFVYGRGMVRRMGAMIAYWKGGPPPVSWRADSPLPAADQPRDDAQTPRLQPLLTARQALLPGLAVGWLRAPVFAVQSVLGVVLLPLVVVGAASLVLVNRRAAALLLALPLYFFVFQSAFLFEWRQVVPIHPPLFVLAGAALVVAGATLDATLARRRHAEAPASPGGGEQTARD